MVEVYRIIEKKRSSRKADIICIEKKKYSYDYYVLIQYRFKLILNIKKHLQVSL
jgi:hypothetical protein